MWRENVKVGKKDSGRKETNESKKRRREKIYKYNWAISWLNFQSLVFQF